MYLPNASRFAARDASAATFWTLSYFIEKPFQNWSRENSSSLIGSVMLYVDLGRDIGDIARLPIA
jgi:hypothetical protein